MAGSSLDESYESLEPSLRRCLQELRPVLRGLLIEMSKAHLMRGRVTEERVKTLVSVNQKAARLRLADEDALERMTDLVGFRIVCNNLEDVARIRDLLHSTDRLSNIREQDYIKEPQESGYRALHLTADYALTGPVRRTIACEIQIRTLAQDTWAVLSHYDLYKIHDSIPDHVVQSSRRLADLLALADGIAQDLREAVSKPLAGVRPESEEVFPETLSFIYHRHFGEDPPDYLVRAAVRACEDAACFRLDLVDRALQDEKLRSAVADAYEEAAGWGLSDETLFLLAPSLAVLPQEQAVEHAALQGRAEREEIDAQWRTEMRSELPDTFEELVDEVSRAGAGSDSSDWLIYQVADYFGALKKCFCGTQVISIETFVENALHHYGIDADSKDRLGSTLYNSGLEVGGPDETGLCAYHEHTMSRND